MFRACHSKDTHGKVVLKYAYTNINYYAVKMQVLSIGLLQLKEDEIEGNSVRQNWMETSGPWLMFQEISQISRDGYMFTS